MDKSKEPISASTIFKPVPGMDNVQISADGTVAIFDGEYRSCYYFRRKGKTAVLYFSQSRTHFYSARMVAQAFVENPFPKRFTKVLFIDGNTENCFYTNLMWGDQRMIYAKRLEGKDTNIQLLTFETEALIIKHLKRGLDSCVLAKMFNTSHATITRIRKRYLTEKHGNKRYHTEVKEHCKNRLETGESSKSVATDLGIRYETLWKWNLRERKDLLSSPCGHIKLKDLKKIRTT